MPTNTYQDILDALEGENISPEFRALLVQKVDQWFRDQKAQEESERLGRLSSIVDSLYQIGEMIAQLPEGKSLVINSEGEIGTARVNPEKISWKKKRVAKRVHSNADAFDTGGTEQNMRTTSFAHPAVVMGFKSGWETMIKHPQIKVNPLAELFVEKYLTVAGDPEKFSYKTVVSPHGTKWTEITIENYPIIFCFTGNFVPVYYIHNGKKVEL